MNGRTTRTKGLGGLFALVLIALAADLLSSDLPLAVRVDDRTYLLPCLTHPPALLDDDQQSLARRAAWIIPTPIPFGPRSSHPGGTVLPLDSPSLRHLAGTDDRGRDVLARLLHGTRTALLVGGAAVLFSMFAGALIGLIAASAPTVDLILSRFIEAGLVFPSYFLLLAIQGALGGAPSTVEVAAAIALTRWPEAARLVRAEAMRIRTLPHVEAARALGATRTSIALRHVLPHAAGPALVQASFGIGQAVLLEAGLSFLGLGVPPPTASWGELLAEAQASGLPWWLVVFPSLAIALTVLATTRAAGFVQVRLSRDRPPIALP